MNQVKNFREERPENSEEIQQIHNALQGTYNDFALCTNMGPTMPDI